MSHVVTAVANGYYGGKIRVPGEVFGIETPEDFSIRWMDTDDAKVISHVRAKSKEKADHDELKAMASGERDLADAVNDKAKRHERWLDAKKKADEPEDDGVETRRVNIGGTDGVVGAEVPKPGAKVSAKDRKALAAATGKEPKSQKDADATLDGLAAQGSDNDDRSRDVAIDQTKSAPDWEAPVAADD